MFSKVLVANRGEIAIRIFRTLHEMGIRSVAIYSEADADALFLEHANEAYLVGPPPATESYLNGPRILEVATDAGAEAVHPCFGFLAENARFAADVTAAGLTWVGPPPEAIEAMGSKVEARRLMEKAGVPIVPGVTDPVDDLAAAVGIAQEIGYPVAVKAAAGGGGKGFRVALTPDDLEDAFEGARRESEKFFADSVVYLERYLPNPRHVEIQVLADGNGQCIHLGERDCSIQRRHQKLVEETPSPIVSDGLRERMGDASIRAALAVDYSGAGTCEYLVQDDDFFFLEMNTRIQVEHTVTEMVTGLDLVREQLRVAAGDGLSITQDDVHPRGHAFECRINAEDASTRFLPTPAPITGYREPSGPGVRVDSGVRAGSDIPEIYDPMVAKLITWDVDRETARRRMIRALDEYVVEGPKTLIPFHRWLFEQPEFIAGGAMHAELERFSNEPTDIPPVDGAAVHPTPDREEDDAELTERRFLAEVDGRRFDVRLRYEAMGPASTSAPTAPRKKRRSGSGASAADAPDEAVTTPMQGTVLRVLVAQDQAIEEGQVICIVEAMKMENEVAAHRAGTLTELRVTEGDTVEADQVIAVVE